MAKSGSTTVHRKPRRNSDEPDELDKFDGQAEQESDINQSIESLLAGIGYSIPRAGRQVAVIISLKRKWADGSLRNRVIDRVLMRRPCSHTIRYARRRYIRRAGQSCYGVTHRRELVRLYRESVYCKEGHLVRMADATTGILTPLQNCWKIIDHREDCWSPQDREDMLAQLKKLAKEMRKNAAKEKRQRR